MLVVLRVPAFYYGTFWVCSDVVVVEGEGRKVGAVGWAAGSEGACDAHVCNSTAMGLKQH